jgi:hypothetical protein
MHNTIHVKGVEQYALLHFRTPWKGSACSAPVIVSSAVAELTAFTCFS